MHRNLRKLLENAEGVSEFIIAVNVDIRGFSEFSKHVESPDVAMYIKRVYMSLVDNYFAGSSFFKPMGDGLLLTFPYNEKNLKEVINDIIKKCWKVISDFGKICKSDPMINFPVPQHIGIGIARGTACRIVTGRTVLDYSGHVLNLASRLMDIARPSGIVFPDSFGADLLDTSEIDKFARTKVYLKGIAEDRPIPIYYSKAITKIAAIHKAPLNKIKWKIMKIEEKLSEFRKLGNYFYHDLLERPTDPDEILVTATYPSVISGKKWKDVVDILNPEFKYETAGDEYCVIINMKDIADRAYAKGVKEGWKIALEIKYPVRTK
ncbi:MAG: adenylate/guanylate cyclase domain-containing protein [Planctomycetota bacterium]|nr:adenylate/guanylate cyclase domain-containing protein [Planctomycetota bacterium]